MTDYKEHVCLTLSGPSMLCNYSVGTHHFGCYSITRFSIFLYVFAQNITCVYHSYRVEYHHDTALVC